jgi:hypothetical protein
MLGYTESKVGDAMVCKPRYPDVDILACEGRFHTGNQTSWGRDIHHDQGALRCGPLSAAGVHNPLLSPIPIPADLLYPPKARQMIWLPLPCLYDGTSVLHGIPTSYISMFTL